MSILLVKLVMSSNLANELKVEFEQLVFITFIILFFFFFCRIGSSASLSLKQPPDVVEVVLGGNSGVGPRHVVQRRKVVS